MGSRANLNIFVVKHLEACEDKTWQCNVVPCRNTNRNDMEEKQQR